MIGLDRLKNIVYFYQQQKDKSVSDTLLLNEVSRCNLFKVMKQVKSNNENYNPYEKLGFEFTMTDKGKPNPVWVFYHVDESTQLNMDIKQLEKWEKIIQDIISGNSAFR
jgi:hypothetical protein